MSVIRARFGAVSGERSRSLPLIQLRRFCGAGGALPLCHGSQRRRRKWGGSTSRWPGQRSLHSSRQRYALGAVGCQKTRGGGAARTFSSPPRPSSWFRFARRAASPFSVAVSRAGGPALDVRFRDRVDLAGGTARDRWSVARCPPEHPPSLCISPADGGRARGTKAAAGVKRPTSPGFGLA